MTLKLDTRFKMSYTDTHIFFLTGPFSNWDESRFTMRLPAVPGLCDESEELMFNCGEQGMMAAKSHLFGDAQTMTKIMAVQPKERTSFNSVPHAQKALGRQVANFQPDVWDAHNLDLVTAVCIAKFGQNERHLKALAATKGRVLVEGASYDPVWGVGLAWNDPLIVNRANWRGLNKLGLALMRTRDILC